MACIGQIIGPCSALVVVVVGVKVRVAGVGAGFVVVGVVRVGVRYR